MRFTTVLISCLCGIISGDPGWFWHVTDFHYDFTYDGRQLSCKQNITNRGKFGDYLCDPPWLLVTSSVKAMKNIKSDVDFIVWTGDSAVHATNDDLSTKIIDETIGNITDLLTEQFPGMSVYASFGNHDYWPDNQFPPKNNLMYNLTLARWRAWINESGQEANFLKGGYYTVVLPSGLRIIVLNTNLYYTGNNASVHETDPAGQFEWLETVLSTSRTSKEKVIVTAHVPPCVHTTYEKTEMYDSFMNRINAIFLHYSDVISAMHYGHNHADVFTVYLDNAAKPVISMFVAPSVSPRIGVTAHNPAVRLVKYDKQTGDTLDILQYYLDLSSANQQENDTWRLEYEATSDYNVQDLKPTSLYQLITRMKKANSKELANYIKWNTVSLSGYTCDQDCQVSHLCGFTNFDMTAFNKCKSSFYTSSATPAYCVWSGIVLIGTSIICFLF